ncbi:hypothetical protein [Methylobacter tundripaludum]|uniref:hypothetical protein n=1 Tax=Methylobacter tundripaludum TaxID=173365 RepID=UPI00048948E1|nr:hypothetical protein [Methylobacter tundripaludum]
MKIETTNIKSKRGGARPGSGRPKGRTGLASIKKIAIRTLEKIMQDETASAEARAMAACKLVDEIKL